MLNKRIYLVGLLTAAILMVAGYTGFRLWRQRSYIADLPVMNRIIDAKPDYFAKLFSCLPSRPDCSGRITTQGLYQVRVIGNPSTDRYPDEGMWRARTPWSLFVLNGKMYVGLGNGANSGPMTNAGPVPVIAYDIQSERFRQETVVPEEQIDRFYEINGYLAIPGEDPEESWDWGNLYVKSEGGWQQRRTVPDFIHVHALAQYRGKLYAGGNSTGAVPPNTGEFQYGSAVAVSEDFGKTWEKYPLGGVRILEFLVVAGKLYAADVFAGPGLQKWLNMNGRQPYHSGIYELTNEGRWQRRLDITAERMFPDTAQAGKRAGYIRRAVSWKDKAVFNAVFTREGEEIPVSSAYLASGLSPENFVVERLPFPDTAQVRDIRVSDGRIWALMTTVLPGGRWRNELMVSADGKNWQEELVFEAPAFAGSFALDKNRVFCGLGGKDYAGILLSFTR